MVISYEEDEPDLFKDHCRRKVLTKEKETNESNKLSKKLMNNFNRNMKVLPLVLILILCIKSLEGRPSVAGLESGEIKGGSQIDTTTPHTIAKTSSTKHPLHRRPDTAIMLIRHEQEHEHIKRYPVSQVDFDHVKTPFIIGIWILSASIAKIAFHVTPQLHKYVPESCLLIIVGVVIGVIILFSTNVYASPLTPDTFFLYMLPPIILDAGYFMPNRKFFDNLGTILLMAVVGTIFNIATIGGALWACGLTGVFGVDDTPGFVDIFLFSSLISAVDPVAVLAVFEDVKVNEVLYIVVFGESLLNDAVTVVMYHMMEAYAEIGVDNIIVQDILSGVASFFVVALGGTIIGIIWGFLLGFVTRFTHHVRIIEPLFVFVMAYLSYLNAEIFHMSGILAITFCGIVAKNYVESNISNKSHTTIKYTLKMLSNSSETIIFMFLGVATVHNNHVWNTWFVILTITFCTVFRSLGVVVLSALANHFRLHKLSGVEQFVMSYGGLRGAVAFALVLLIDDRVVPQKDMFVTTTIAVIYFTVFLQGITIKPLVEILNVKRANKRELTMSERIHERFMDHVMAGIEDIIGCNGNYNLRDKFRRINDRFIRPLLIRDQEKAEHKFIRTYSKLTMRDAMAVMHRNQSTLSQIPANESISNLFQNYAPVVESSYYRQNLEAPCSRNFDIHELDYYPSKRDIFDAEIHHLSSEQYKPYRSRPRETDPEARKLGAKGAERTTKIRFKRYITNKKHLKLLQQNSVSSNHSDKTQQNLVSFSDQTTEYPKALNNVSKRKPHNDDDDDGGLTFSIKQRTPVKNLSHASSIEEDIDSPKGNNIELPWRDTSDSPKSPNRDNNLQVWVTNKEHILCDIAKNDLHDTIPYIDSNNSNLSSTSNKKDSKKTANSSSPKSDDYTCSTIESLRSVNGDCNGTSQKTDEQPIDNNDVPIICADLTQCLQKIEEVQEFNEKVSLLLNSKKHHKREKGDNVEVTMTLLPDSSSDNEDDEEIDKYCELYKKN